MTNEEIYKPLTPKFRQEIIDSIDSNINELSTCRDNVFVSAYSVGYKALKGIISSLPDGYPIPMRRG